MKKQSSWLLSLSLGLFLTLSVSGQEQFPKKIEFRGETIEFPHNVQNINWKNFPATSKLNNGYLGWINFEKTPTQDIQDEFKSLGLELIDYIPHQTYLFYFSQEVSTDFLIKNGVSSIIPLSASEKQSVALKSGHYEWWAMDGEQILISLEFFKNANVETILSEFKTLPITITNSYPEHHMVDLSIPQSYIDVLASRPYVKWMDLVLPPAVPEDTKGKSLHRSSNLDTQTSAGRNYTGEGVGVLVRDDGFVGPHIDFEGRITNLTNVRNQSHGDGVAGIMAGAGNLLPANRGMAAGANIFVVNYEGTYLDYSTNNLINTDQVQITNSSYGQGCNEGYNATAREVDRQTRNKESLLHVFSAGNSNGQNCGYGAGSQWGNITGGHKQGKNVIATANVYFDGSLVQSSSRGPAYDGRIKPDIAANGQGQISTNENNTYQTFSGTSGAAPGIAGVSAQLYQAYSELNNGSLPPGGLIKATLLNTASDYGNEGPDFKFGWGIVNGLQAAKLIEEERYLTGSITQGATNTHTFTVPANAVQVRFMVYWDDKEAAPGASQALINDLDLTVTSPSNETLLPWILDHTPNATTLNLPATRGVDRLNNMEQVQINNPAAGTYTLNISGHNVPVGPQDYFVVYEIIENNLNLTYPVGGEKFQSNQYGVIHWDAVNTTEPFVLSYSTDNGTTWNPITTVAADIRVFEWRAPNILTGNCLVKVTSGAFESISPQPFNIGRSPQVINVSEMCETSMTITWTATSGADSYDVYLLGEKYMEIVGSTSETSLQIPITDPNKTYWFSVAAKNQAEGWVAERARAKKYDDGIQNCSVGVDDFESDLGIMMYPNPATGEFTLKFGQEISEKTNVQIVNNLGQILKRIDVTNQQQQINISDLSQGLYFVKIQSGQKSVTKKLFVK